MIFRFGEGLRLDPKRFVLNAEGKLIMKVEEPEKPKCMHNLSILLSKQILHSKTGEKKKKKKKLKKKKTGSKMKRTKSFLAGKPRR